VEARNQADSAIYAAEKLLHDAGDKVPQNAKAEVESLVAALRSAVSGEDIRAIQGKVKELSEALQRVGESMYQQPGPTPPPAGEQPGEEPGEQPGKGPEDVVDGEYRQA